MKAAAIDDVERVVLLDEDGHVVGSMAKSGVHGSATPLHLAFSCWVFDDAARVLLTRRAPGKTFEGVWTNAVCGHPAPGEELGDAVRRRCRDELGLDVGPLRLVLPDFRYRAEQDGVVENEICPVLVARVRGGVDLTPEPAEVADLDWVPWDQLRADIASGRRVISAWAHEQSLLLAGLGDDPATWPQADPADLPPALRAK
ncbi:MAG: isopentenyl-diphosphate Delta-isomerase [Tetrasphaera sp.]